MFSRVLNGASSPANCARKIAGPLIVCISANSRNLTEHLIMFSPSVPKFSCRSHGLVLVSFATREKTFRHRFVEVPMPRNVRCGLIQVRCEWSPEKFSLGAIREKMIPKHERLIPIAGKQKVQILGLQELFYGPYFCAEQQTRWYELTERAPTGPTISRMQKLAKQHRMVLVVPIYEVEMAGVYYNTPAVIAADRRHL